MGQSIEPQRPNVVADFTCNRRTSLLPISSKSGSPFPIVLSLLGLICGSPGNRYFRCSFSAFLKPRYLEIPTSNRTRFSFLHFRSNIRLILLFDSPLESIRERKFSPNLNQQFVHRRNNLDWTRKLPLILVPGRLIEEFFSPRRNSFYSVFHPPWIFVSPIFRKHTYRGLVQLLLLDVHANLPDRPRYTPDGIIRVASGGLFVRSR